jgi:hypothetical protein
VPTVPQPTTVRSASLPTSTSPTQQVSFARLTAPPLSYAFPATSPTLARPSATAAVPATLSEAAILVILSVATVMCSEQKSVMIVI